MNEVKIEINTARVIALRGIVRSARELHAPSEIPAIGQLAEIVGEFAKVALKDAEREASERIAKATTTALEETHASSLVTAENSLFAQLCEAIGYEGSSRQEAVRLVRVLRAEETKVRSVLGAHELFESTVSAAERVLGWGQAMESQRNDARAEADKARHDLESWGAVIDDRAWCRKRIPELEAERDTAYVQIGHLKHLVARARGAFAQIQANGGDCGRVATEAIGFIDRMGG